MTVLSGQRLLGLLPAHDPATAYLRTLLASSRWDSQLFSLTWKVSATTFGTLRFRLVPSRPTTFGSASGSLRSVVPTPRAEGFDAGPHRGKPDSLHAMVKAQARQVVTTPTANDGRQGANGVSQRERNSLTATVRSPSGERPTGTLSPEYVEWLLAFPDGWTDPGRPGALSDLLAGRLG